MFFFYIIRFKCFIFFINYIFLKNILLYIEINDKSKKVGYEKVFFSCIEEDKNIIKYNNFIIQTLY